jgi:uncharacterized protein (TIGR04255 family)
MKQATFDPFENAYEEIPLNNAPVVQSLCQVQFPTILKISDAHFIADFQEAIRASYPVVSQDVSQVMSMTAAGANIESIAIWRFLDSTQQWRVSLTQNALTLETRAYKSRADFLEKVKALFEIAHDKLKPSHVARVAVRHINHLEEGEDGNASTLLREDLCATYGAIKKSPTTYMMSEMLLSAPQGSLRAKWGFLPANSTHDFENMQPKSKPSSFLDVDAFVEHGDLTMTFEPGAIVKTAGILSAACYNFFRWRVNDKLIESNRISL